MVALPDFDREVCGPPLCGGGGPDVPTQTADRAVARIGLRLGGTGLIAAAFGLWVLRSDEGDPAMMLIKLLFSIMLFGAGIVGFLAARRPDIRPEVQVDRRARELRVLTPDPAGAHDVAVYGFDDLEELSLHDGLLSARDRSGDIVVSLEVTGGRGERTLRKALAGAL